MSINIIIYIIIFIFGLILGSFYNVVGYRLPNNMSISFPPSHCTKCNHRLKPYQLVPVFSYIFLKGKCKYCGNKISIIYPLVELLTGILFLLSYIVYGFDIKFIISITFISVLIIITISDIRYYIIPDEILLTGVLLIIFEYIISYFIKDGSFMNIVVIPILNALASFALLYLFKIFGDLVFKKESLGGGDIKLLFLIGLVLGFDMSIITIFIAAFIALPLSVILLIRNDNNVVAFGPYLSISAIIILLTKLDLNIVLNFFIK